MDHGSGGASGLVRVATNHFEESERSGLGAMVATLPTQRIDVDVKHSDSHSYQEDMGSILRSGEYDVVSWFAGYRNRSFAESGLLADISDVWERSELSQGFRHASTGWDGKQYFVPTSCYVWAVHYSRRLFSEMGYAPPTNRTELFELADRMLSDGITPFANTNDGQWPSMGVFAILNMRINGPDYHLGLLRGAHEWTDPRTRAVFETWESLLPYHQPDANFRTWHEGARALQAGEVGMYMVGTFVASFSEQLASDIDFFTFPELDPAIGSGALDAPTDGFQMVASSPNPEAAKEFLRHASTARAQNAWFAQASAVIGVAPHPDAGTSGYDRLQRRSRELVMSATAMTNFADRDTDPDFASEGLGPLLADFLDNPAGIADGLARAQEVWGQVASTQVARAQATSAGAAPASSGRASSETAGSHASGAQTSGGSGGGGDGERVDTTRLQRLARAYAETAVFYSAIDLELFTHVSQGATSVPALATAMGTSELNAERLVTVTLAQGLLEKNDDGTLRNAPDCEKFMVKGNPRYAGAWMTFTRAEVPDWFDLSGKLTDPSPPTELGMYDGLTVERARKYHRATYSIGMGAGRRFCRTVDLTGRRRLLDLGGGSGAYSINAVKTFDGLEAVVLDLPPVVVVTQEYLEENEVTDKVTTHGADFINDPLPTGCDVAVMASNLPIYSAENIAKVIQKTFDVLEPGGEMHLVGETLNADGVGPIDAALWGMAEINYGANGSGGRSHSVTECIGYFERAGFVDVVNTDFVPGTLTRTFGRKP